MDFKNKISTSIEQSKKLLELGLKAETADMAYRKFTEDSVICNTWDWSLGIKPSGEGVIPSWSLSRLIELMPKSIKGRKTGFTFYLIHYVGNTKISYYSEVEGVLLCEFDGDSAFDAAIKMIDWLILNKYFNKEYLCKRK